VVGACAAEAPLPPAAGGAGEAGAAGLGGDGGRGGVVAATFRVSPDGSDDNDCSAAAPCRTLQYAAVVAAPGSVVVVDDGAYAGFHTVHDGVTFRAAGSGAVIDSGAGDAPDNVDVTGNDGVVVEGFTIVGAERAGVRVISSGDVVIRGNVIRGSGMWGILTGFAPRIRIIANETHGTVVEHGIYVSNSDGGGDDPVIYGNHSHDNYGNGIQINGDCHAGGDGVITGAVLEANHVHHNGHKGLSMISAPGVRVVNNLVHDNGFAGGAAAIHLVNEPHCGESFATRDGVVVNNTIVEAALPAVRMDDGASGNLVFNNILVAPEAVIDDVGGNRLASNLAAATPHGLGLDGALRPAPGGPASNAGLALFAGAAAPPVDYAGAARPLGPAIDLGAYEVE
jgi:hypothetical protein